MFVCYGLMPEINVHSFTHSFIHTQGRSGYRHVSVKRSVRQTDA